MKKIVKRVLFLAIVGTVIMGCEKEDNSILSEENEIKTEENETKKQIVNSNKSSASLAEDIIDFGNYLNERNNSSEGALSNYMINNPSFSFHELDSLGYLNDSIASNYSSAISSEVDILTDNEISDAIIQVSNEAGFSLETNGGELGNQEIRRWDGFVIIRWNFGTGCFQMFCWETERC